MPVQGLSAKEPCPQCGQSLDRWPTLEPGGFLLICTECGFEQSQLPSADSDQENPDQTEPSDHQKLQLLLQENDPNEWPEELLEALPPEARAKLAEKVEKSTSNVPPVMEKRLRGYGYLLADDGQGARLTGEGPKPGTGDLSPMDIVRLAAELEGGLPAEAERKACPNCQAVRPPGSQHCQWCGQHLAGPPDPPQN